MVTNNDYMVLPGRMRIRFDAPGLDLREISLVSAQIHRLVNKVAHGLYGLPQGYPGLYSTDRPFGLTRDPLLVSLELTGLAYGSFSAETRLRIYRIGRDLAIGVAGSLIASVIWSIADSGVKSVKVEEKPSDRAPATYPRESRVDVGPNIRNIAKGMEASGKNWELLVEDTQTGQRVIIRSFR